MKGYLMIKEYLLQNWSFILVLAAFAIALRITVFWDEKTIKRMYVLIIGVYLLSLVVFVEFNCTAQVEYRTLRSILMAIRYSATPFIISQIICSGLFPFQKMQHEIDGDRSHCLPQPRPAF